MTPEQLKSYTPAADLLKDRVILITGASDGLGRVVANQAAAHGATIILLSKTINKLEHVYDEIEAAGGPQPAIYPMNLEGATVKDYDDLATNIEKEFGRLDGLVNNAAWLGDMTPIVLYKPETWSRVITVNLHAPFLLTQACLPLLGRAEDPAIIFSTHDVQRAYWGAYGVAKAGLEGFMKILAAESQGDIKIRVNGIDTGPIRTHLRRQAYPAEVATDHPLPEVVAPAYLYALGPDCRETGKNFKLAE
jgi:NAD(P)-dependent dehydrogenase (short-subunit alcohol dehydrogenase family)